jgi:hypothetical protein
MIQKTLSISVLILSLAFLSFDIPKGWFAAGSKPDSYEMGVDKGSATDGSNAATIKSIEKKINGFGTLMQDAKPGNYLGKRIRLSASIKSEKVDGWAGLWLRVDQANSKASLSFDNMSDRKIKGTTPWTKYEIVLDVPDNASKLAYGALLSGTGQIWFDNLKFEIVDSTISVTGKNMSGSSPSISEPVNLDFEK